MAFVIRDSPLLASDSWVIRIRQEIRPKACVVLAATLILPVLANAGTDNGKGNDRQNNGNQNGRDQANYLGRTRGKRWMS